MVTYCTGNISAKRRAFRAVSPHRATYVDNDEVLAEFTLGQKQYIVCGSVPFANMSLCSFVSYNRSLRSSLPVTLSSVKAILKSVGLRKGAHVRMGALGTVDYRAACLASKLEVTTADIYVNFDGFRFSKRNRRRLNRYLRVWSKKYNVFVAVSDGRFIPPLARVLHYGSDGVEEKRTSETSKKVRIRTLRRRLRRAGIQMNIPLVETAVVCES